MKIQALLNITLSFSFLNLTKLPVAAKEPVINNIQSISQQAVIPQSAKVIVASPPDVTLTKQKPQRSPKRAKALLFYNASNGQGATAQLDSAGKYQYVSALSGFGRWTHIAGL